MRAPMKPTTTSTIYRQSVNRRSKNVIRRISAIVVYALAFLAQQYPLGFGFITRWRWLPFCGPHRRSSYDVRIGWKLLAFAIIIASETMSHRCRNSKRYGKCNAHLHLRLSSVFSTNVKPKISTERSTGKFFASMIALFSLIPLISLADSFNIAFAFLISHSFLDTLEKKNTYSPERSDCETIKQI